MEKNLKKCIFLYIFLNHFAVHLKLTQHCKSTILQFKKRRRGGFSSFYIKYRRKLQRYGPCLKKKNPKKNRLMKKAVTRLYILILMTLVSIRSECLKGLTYPRRSRTPVFMEKLNCDSSCKCQQTVNCANIFLRIITVFVSALVTKFYKF